MMRSLWTAASGMIAQQQNVDTISNNLANVNTTGYKKETVEFKSLLYQTVQSKTTSANGETKPVGAQVGLGVRTAAITSVFTQGSLLHTEEATDFAIDGKAFFAVRGYDGQTHYTRNGDFSWALMEDGIGLCTSDGYPVLDENREPIVIQSMTDGEGGGYDTTKVTINSYGQVCYPDENNNPQPIGIQIGLVQFDNPAGLTKKSDSFYDASDASGEALWESENDTLEKSSVKQYYIEGSNVQIVDEMVNLIVAQRAYEMNSKAITASDEMLSQANQLKR